MATRCRGVVFVFMLVAAFSLARSATLHVSSREDLLHIRETSKCEYRLSFLFSPDNFAVALDLGLEKWPTSKAPTHVHVHMS